MAGTDSLIMVKTALFPLNIPLRKLLPLAAITLLLQKVHLLHQLNQKKQVRRIDLPYLEIPLLYSC